MALREEIEKAKWADLQSAERAVAQCVPAVPVMLSEDDKAILLPFAQWCAAERVRHLPARPSTVAAYLYERRGLGEHAAIKTIQAIERLHDSHGLANPAATAVVRQVLAEIVKTEPPRGWTKDEKAAFAMLPPEIQSVIARREQERDAGLRKLQNELRSQQKELENGEEKRGLGKGRRAIQPELPETSSAAASAAAQH